MLTRHRRRAIALFALTVVALVVLVIRPPSRSAEKLRALAETTLTYPGSEVIAHGEYDSKATVDGRLSATVWQYLGVDASPHELESFYARELGTRGWVEDLRTSSGIRTVEELITRAWRKDGVIFRVGIQDPRYAGANPELFLRYRSIYDARLIESADGHE